MGIKRNGIFDSEEFGVFAESHLGLCEKCWIGKRATVGLSKDGHDTTSLYESHKLLDARSKLSYQLPSVCPRYSVSSPG